MYKYLLPLPQRDYFRLSAASFAEAEELVSGSTGFGEQEVKLGF